MPLRACTAASTRCPPRFSSTKKEELPPSMWAWRASEISKMRLNSSCKATCLLSLLITTAALAQSSGYLTIGEPSKVAGKRNAAVQTKIVVSVREGYHVNSNTPSEEYLIPLKLTWTSTGALEGGTVTYPKPLQEKF